MVTGARARMGAVVEDGNKLKVRLEAHQTIECLKGLIIKLTKGLKCPFGLQKHSSKPHSFQSTIFDDGKTLGDCGLVSGSVLCVPQLDIYFVLPKGLFCDCSRSRTSFINFTIDNLGSDKHMKLRTVTR